MTELLDRIRASLIGLRMPRALAALDHTLRRLERGELSAIEAIDGLLAEEHATRESRRIAVALKTARLNPPKTLESFDFSSSYDFKTRLQETAQAQLKATPEYRVLGESGPDHDKTFEVCVLIQGREWARASGKSKKAAEQRAAAMAAGMLDRGDK